MADFMDDFLEPHRLRCRKCGDIFTTVLPNRAILRGFVKCPKCDCSTHDILDGFTASAIYADNQKYIDLVSPRRHTPPTSDMYDSLLYGLQERYKNKIETYFFNTEEKNMKRTTNNNEETRNFEIVRKYTTEIGIFTVGQLEPTDMFVLIDDEEQTVYMAVKEEEPKYKTKKAVVNMHTGDLVYLDVTTKIHVYRPGTSELRVGEFLYSSKDYK